MTTAQYRTMVTEGKVTPSYHSLALRNMDNYDYDTPRIWHLIRIQITQPKCSCWQRKKLPTDLSIILPAKQTKRVSLGIYNQKKYFVCYTYLLSNYEEETDYNVKECHSTVLQEKA